MKAWRDKALIPVIGITFQYDDEFSRFRLEKNYSDALYEARALPVMLTGYSAEYSERLAEQIDGLLLSGGPDIDPPLYGELTQSECVKVSKFRDEIELPLYKACSKHKMPVLGICRGAQVMNAARGGTLFQHIEGHGGGVEHNVTVLKDTLLYDIFKKEKIKVNSYHHQSVNVPAPGGQICGYSDDDRIVELISFGKDVFDIGVQFHPERMYKFSEEASRLFDAFVLACADYRRKKHPMSIK